MRSFVTTALSALGLAAVSGCSTLSHAPVGSPGLETFRDDAELSSYLNTWAKQRRQLLAKERDAAERKWRKTHRNSDCGNTTSKVVVTKRWKSRAASSPRDIVIKGIAHNRKGDPISATNVAYGVNRANTGANGSFRLRMTYPLPQDQRLVIRGIGFQAVLFTETVTNLDSIQIDVTLCSSIYQLSDIVTTGVATAAAEKITNTQHDDVDEGGLVKLHGNYLIVLRHGQLFSVSTGNGQLKAISRINAFAPGLDPENTWYDEVLTYQNTIVVIGYSYQRGGTEIGLFSIDSSGKLGYRATYHLRSNDYYSSRNYASRLSRSELILYQPVGLSEAEDNVRSFPAMARWTGDSSSARFVRILNPHRVYRPAVPLDPAEPAALHTVVTCDLAAQEFACQAKAVPGADARVSYVSPTGVYIWTAKQRKTVQGPTNAMLYRLPFGEAPASAVGTRGSPVDALSFLETPSGQLNVLTIGNGIGEAMWRGEWRAGNTFLLQLPLAEMGNGTTAASEGRYTPLPAVLEPVIHNRFIGEYLLYGGGNGWGRQRTTSSTLHVVDLRSHDVHAISLSHGSDRIESLGSEAMVIGGDGRNLHFTSVSLETQPAVGKKLVKENASQGELRTHGFYYRADDDTHGILGLPIRDGGASGYEHLIEGSASIVFIRNDDSLRFAGELKAADVVSGEADCVASCTDWYGNARPIFVGSRIFALMGYELIEGRMENGRINELNRINFRVP